MTKESVKDGSPRWKEVGPTKTPCSSLRRENIASIKGNHERNDEDLMKEMEVSSAREDSIQDAVKRKKADIAEIKLEQVKAEADAARSEAEVVAAQEEVKRAMKEFMEACR